MKKAFLTTFAVALFLLMTACSEQSLVPDNKHQISFSPIASISTKAPVAGTTLPDDMPMYVSAYFNPAQGTADPAMNYFTDVEFVKEPAHARWYTEIPRYWPISGTLNFLAYATYSKKSSSNPSGIVEVASWTSPNCSQGVTLTVADNDLVRDDLLFGAVNTQHYNANGNPLTLKHANALIVFRLSITDNLDNFNSIVLDAHQRTNVSKNVGLVVDSIKMNNIQYGGTFTVTNDIAGSTVSGAWSNLTPAKTTFVYDTTPGGNVYSPDTLRQWNPGVNTYADTKTTEPFGDAYVVLPQQTRTSFTIYYTLHNGIDGNGAPFDQELTYTYDCTNANPWQMGNKYVYEINFDLHKITIAPSVEPWLEPNENYQYINVSPGAAPVNP